MAVGDTLAYSLPCSCRMALGYSGRGLVALANVHDATDAWYARIGRATRHSALT